ncbi:sensor histidine kinase [Actinomadura rupiterrae]|uniref:sensor histidine kinase n=1 Tax=Actinomadura rupiterrae TaxID=559627 RepID=UPI0020A3EF64|nr:HAMP domain-containing sensor histidine kinase [Actinomadura rupiterrae]MCP2343544.1 signal transduction histidine kinase [Actinomadura rupiterrae]
MRSLRLPRFLRAPGFVRSALGRRTVRLRLTLLYGALFLVCGTALVGITYLLASQSTPGVYTSHGPNGDTNALARGSSSPGPDGSLHSTSGENGGSSVSNAPAPARAADVAKQSERQAREQRAGELRSLLVQSGTALGITTVISLGVGWVVAGNVLRRLQRVTDAARTISASNLHERLALDGPQDELKELGDTFDELLARLEGTFLAQRQFIAHVSHELRTPMARQRTLAQVALADPDATVESLRSAHERVLAAGAQQEQLVLALLTLARGQAGISRREPFDLAPLARDVVLNRSEEAQRLGVTVRTDLAAAPVAGDARLTERMITNLVDNALRHNVPGGRVEVTASARDGSAVLTVANTGRVIPEPAVEQLFEPFERLGAVRAEGLGLGLSIVRAIADAHGAAVVARPRSGGGLVMTVTFPPPAAPARRGAETRAPVRV